MPRWIVLETEAPELAAKARALLYQLGVGLGYLATIRPDGGPRLHPVCPVLANGGLYVLLAPSPKRTDLVRDVRFALHTFPARDRDDEFFAVGTAQRIVDPAVISAVRAAQRAAGVTSGEHDWLFELEPERALIATYKKRGEPDNCPPFYTQWKPGLPLGGFIDAPLATSVDPGVTWSEFASLTPALAATGKAMVNHAGIGLGYLATVRRDGGPRVHPFCPIITDSGLYALIGPSPKRGDLLRDGRYALHTFPFGTLDDEFALTGLAHHVRDASTMHTVLAAYRAMGGGTSANELVFELRIHRALHARYGERGQPDYFPPRYTKWKAGP